MPPDAFRIKLLRRKLLEHLNMVYPSGMPADALCRTLISLDPTYDLDLMKKDAYYLHDKGYLEFVDEAIGGLPFARKVARLTADGKEIADRTDSDDALEI